VLVATGWVLGAQGYAGIVGGGLQGLNFLIELADLIDLRVYLVLETFSLTLVPRSQSALKCISLQYTTDSLEDKKLRAKGGV